MAALAGFPCVRVLSPEDVRDADVLVAFADDVSEQILERVEQISASRKDVQVVLVMESVSRD
ncbi:hypothetical protein [Streptomyces mirabilis]|uniref:hypothetical protein n=1 Tax=Streptomyces mirabilis TaxID=68239 RepID=UPI0033B805D6